MDASQNRIEFKFVLPCGLGEVVRNRVSELLVSDRGAEDGYPVLSEYFDTRERNSYWQKQFGVPNRRRVRSRVYGRNEAEIPASAFIEVKHKLDGVTVKRRVSADLDELPLFSKGIVPASRIDATPADERILAEIDELVTEEECRPVVQIRYHRFAYDSGPEGNIRITFDNDPRCRFRQVPLIPDDPDFELPLLEPGSSIMEVKTIGSVPYWFRKIVGEFNLIPRGFSKYTAALELYEFKSRSLVSSASSSCPSNPDSTDLPKIANRSVKPDEKKPGAPAITTVPGGSNSLPLRAREALRSLISKALPRFRIQ